ncbi:MAG: hypothetical protein VKL39_21425 [Leptolyngbyaceae bacterium]|nr:hypothetical protein [Leptolyngbyaceae bacterium]
MRRVSPRASSPRVSSPDKSVKRGGTREASCQVVYGSAIALQLAPKLQHSSERLAHQIRQGLSSECSLTASGAIAVPSEGWITFSISESCLLEWLRQFVEASVYGAMGSASLRDTGGKDDGFSRQDQVGVYLANNRFISRSAPSTSEIAEKSKLEGDHLWLSQYAHARCCAWLKILDEQDCIESVSFPITVPVQGAGQGTDSGHTKGRSLDEKYRFEFCEHSFQDHASVDLLLGLIDSVDDICESLHSSHQNSWAEVERWLIQLSHRVLNYQATNPIITFLQGSDRPTVEAHRLLMQATRQWLHTLLVEALDRQAPTVL